jgi:hypothetical protein
MDEGLGERWMVGGKEVFVSIVDQVNWIDDVKNKIKHIIIAIDMIVS